MDIDDNKDTITRLYGHNVITALAGDHMCQEVLMNADSRSACTCIVWYERTM